MKPLALLIFPPIYDFALYDLFLKPYSLLKLGKWLNRSGFRVKLVNALDYRDPMSLKQLGKPKRESGGTGKFFRQITEKPDALQKVKRNYARYGILRTVLENKIGKERPDIVFITSGMTYWYPGVIEAVRTVKGISPGVPVVVGGIYATLCEEHARKKTDADYVVAGDAFPEIMEILKSLSLPFENKPIQEELLLLPEALLNCGVIRINRGCPFHCKYCSSYVLSNGFHAGDPDIAFYNVQKMNKRFGTSSFSFYDDALLARKDSGIIPFLEKVISSGLNLSFYLPNAVHLCFLDAAVAGMMKKAGFCEIRLGFESAYPDFHNSMDKKLKPCMLEEGLEILYSADFLPGQISVYILAGLPGQYREEVEESIRYTASLGIRVIVAEYSPVPLSPLWEESVRVSRFPLNDEPLTHNNSIFPMQWEGLSLQDLKDLKLLAVNLSSQARSKIVPYQLSSG